MEWAVSPYSPPVRVQFVSFPQFNGGKIGGNSKSLGAWFSFESRCDSFAQRHFLQECNSFPRKTHEFGGIIKQLITFWRLPSHIQRKWRWKSVEPKQALEWNIPKASVVHPKMKTLQIRLLWRRPLKLTVARRVRERKENVFHHSRHLKWQKVVCWTH